MEAQTIVIVAMLLLVQNTVLCRPANEDLLASRAQEAEESKPDMFLGWMNNPALSQFRPLFAQIQETMGPMSQQVSGQILDNVPGAKDLFKQVQSMQEQLGSMVSQFNPAQTLQQSNGPSKPATNQ